MGKLSFSPLWAGIFLVVVGAILSSSKAIIIKLAYVYEVDAVSLLALRMAFATPFFFVMAYLYRGKHAVAGPPFTRRDYLLLLGVGLLGYYLASLFDFIGLEYVSAGIERLILYTYPTLVLLLSHWFFKSALVRLHIWALVLVYIGIALVMLGDINVPESSLLIKGGIWVFLSALAYALYILGSASLIPRWGVIRFTSLAMCVAGTAILLQAAISPQARILGWPSPVYGYAALIAIISTILPPYLMSAGIMRIGANRTAIVGSVGPVSTLVLAFFFLGEVMSFWQLLGTAIVLAGVGLISIQKEKSLAKP